LQEKIKHRTKAIGLAIIKLIPQLDKGVAQTAIARQLVRSATSVGANYRAACRAKSTADFVNKLKIVEEEADETLYWLEVLTESGLLDHKVTKPISKEVDELLSIIVASIRTTKAKITKPKP
jgi:four helix bundle protein